MTTGESQIIAGGRTDVFQSISADLAQLDDLEQIFERALDLSLNLSSSRFAFIGLVDSAGLASWVDWRGADPSFAPPRGMIERLVAAAASDGPVTLSDLGSLTALQDGLGPLPCLGAQLRVGNEVFGSLGVAGATGYSDVEKQLMSSFASAVAAAIELVRVREAREPKPNQSSD